MNQRRVRGELTRKGRLEKYETWTVTVVVSIGLEVSTFNNLTERDVANIGQIVSSKRTSPNKPR